MTKKITHDNGRKHIVNNDKPLLKLLIAAQIILLLTKFVLYQDLHWAIVLLPTEILIVLVVFCVALIAICTYLQAKSKRSLTRNNKK